MHSYSKTFKVDPQDLDELKHVNNIRYVEWIQEISKEHWFKATNEAIRKDLIWVVKNHDITYHRSAILGDAVRLSTYIAETKGPISKRVVEITNNKTGDLLVKGITKWCLLDAHTFRPKRVPETVQQLFNNS